MRIIRTKRGGEDTCRRREGRKDKRRDEEKEGGRTG